MKNTYSLSKTKKMISINDETINFNASFSITSTKNIPFQCIIANQHILDTTDPSDLRYETFTSTSGEVIVNNNVYQHWYIILKSAEPNEVEITIDFEKLPDYIPQIQPSTPSSPPPSVKTDRSVVLTNNKDTNSNNSNNNNIQYILYLIILVIIAYFVYKTFSSEKSSSLPTPISILDKIKRSTQNSTI